MSRVKRGLVLLSEIVREKIMVALSEKIQKPQSIVALKMLAARIATLFARECGIQQSSFKGDSEFVINSLRHGELLHSSIGYFLKDTMSYVSSLQSFSFFHVGRHSNSVAHALAQGARLSFPIVVWMESVPPDINSFVMFDISSIE